MRILIVADFASIHVYNYVLNVISKLECECIGYHYSKSTISSLYLNYYNVHGIKIVYGVDPDVYQKEGAISFSKKTFKKLNNLGKFDFMHLHAVRLFICPALFLASKNFKNIILTYWGSDLYRSTRAQLIKTLPLLHKANIIVMMTDDMKAYFQRQPWYIRQYSSKIQVSDFGNMFYEKIKNYSQYKNILKTDFGFDQKKMICTIGYVGRPQMQQYETINAIFQFLIKYKNSIQIAIPAYGITDNDYSRIEGVLKVSGVQYSIFTEFMDSDKVSKFRAITDIFVHSQTTDALSSAMLEHLYAGSIVVNGEWLKYSSLDDNGIYFHQFSSFSTLSEVLERVILNFKIEADKSNQNADKVARISSWEYLRNNWINLYK